MELNLLHQTLLTTMAYYLSKLHDFFVRMDFDIMVSAILIIGCMFRLINFVLTLVFPDVLLTPIAITDCVIWLAITICVTIIDCKYSTKWYANVQNSMGGMDSMVHKLYYIVYTILLVYHIALGIGLFFYAKNYPITNDKQFHQMPAIVLMIVCFTFIFFIPLLVLIACCAFRKS